MDLHFFPVIIVLAFIFELMDSSAGMGFGTALAPMLFLLGYDPLQVVPILLISESVTGLVSAFFHNEYSNVSFSFKKPLNQATRATILIAGIGCVAVALSVILVYAAIDVPEVAIKYYVAFLLLVMGVIGLYRFRLGVKGKYNPKKLAGFAALAGLNKGIGGGGYGPVVMMGQLFSGVYEKSATAIVSLAEGIVSVVGVIAFFILNASGLSLDFILLPSIFTGSYLAALISPYLVRVLPNKVWKVVIPTYTAIVGIGLLIKLS